MNRDDVTRWAREANRYASNQTNDSHDWQEIRDERFAKAAYAAGAAAEREECKQACWDVETNDWEGRKACIDAIRARGQK